MRVVKIDQGTEQIPDPQIELDQLQLEYPLVLVIWRDAFFDFDADNDPWNIFNAIGDLLVTGPTLTNVNDFRAILIEKS